MFFAKILPWWQGGSRAGMRAARRVGLLLGVVMAGFSFSLFMPETEARCSGTDMLPRIQREDPAAYAKIVAAEAALPHGGALFWKIEKDGLPPSWLFGTIHLNDKRLVALPQPVRAAIASSKIVALESDTVLDKAKIQAEMVKNLHYISFRDGTTLSSHLSAEERAALQKLLSARGLSFAQFNGLKPWFVMTSLALPPCEMLAMATGGDVVDQVVARLGQKAGAKIIGLETTAEQFAAFDSLGIPDQKQLLMLTVRSAPVAEDQNETMKLLYLQERTGALWALSDYLADKFGSGDKGPIKAFKRALVSKRNEVMAKRAAPFLTKGGIFIAVGALHLPGKTGLVALFEKQGYRLTPVKWRPRPAVDVESP